MSMPQITKSLYFSSEEKISNMVHITLLPKDLASYWQRCGLTADFGASFASFCFPEIKYVTNSLSVILNELVENAVKYSFENSKRIEITLCDNEGYLYFEVVNYISEMQKEKFEKFINKMASSHDISQMYSDAMEASMSGEESGLGLLTILNDYNVGISFSFIPDEVDSTLYLATLQVRIKPEDIAC